MLTIRSEQLDVLAQPRLKRFEDWMVAHINKFFPTESQMAGAIQVRENIQYGIKRASTYGITSERDVCKYIDLMMVFGRDFDTNHELPWAGQILNTRNSASSRISVLVKTAEKYLPHS